ncbi:unnamed protein product [Lota lota]
MRATGTPHSPEGSGYTQALARGTGFGIKLTPHLRPQHATKPLRLIPGTDAAAGVDGIDGAHSTLSFLLLRCLVSVDLQRRVTAGRQHLLNLEENLERLVPPLEEEEKLKIAI